MPVCVNAVFSLLPVRHLIANYVAGFYIRVVGVRRTSNVRVLLMSALSRGFIVVADVWGLAC